MKFTLKSVFFAIAMLALACAGMTYRTSWWVDGLVATSTFLFVFAGLIAIRLAGRELVCCIAFATIGAGYLLIALTRTPEPISNSLPTNYILSASWTAFGKPTLGREYGPKFGTPANLSQVLREWKKPTNIPFFLIGHCVFSWIFAVLAGWFAGRMYDRREKL